MAEGLDAIHLSLHGAMIIEDEPDAEAEIVRRVRALLKPGTPIVLERGDVRAELGRVNKNDLVVFIKDSGKSQTP